MKMRDIKCCILFLMLLLPAMLTAQDATIKASAKSVVDVGEQFQVVYDINAKAKDFKAPAFNNFDVVGGPFTSSSTNVQWVNGTMTQNVSNKYTYVLKAYKEGDFSIGSATATVDGKTISSNTLNIKVEKGSGGSSSSSSTTSSSSGAVGTSSGSSEISNRDLYLSIHASSKTVYVGEPLTVTYKIHTRVPVSSVSVSKMPAYAGFWMKDVSDNSGVLKQTQEGEFTAAEIRKVILIPQKVDGLPVEPMGVECVAQVRRQNSRQSYDPFEAFFNDPFFSGGYVNVTRDLLSPSLTIKVLPTPEEGKPAGYAGAVGSYTMTTEIDKTTLDANDAFTITVTLKGNGNIELAETPKFNFPPDFEVYDPKITTSIQGVSGTKKAEYLVIPRHAGDYKVPSAQFSFFNPTKKQYETISTPEYDIHVNKGSGGGESGVYTTNQENIKYIGSDIRHIMTGNPGLQNKGNLFFASLPYFLVLLLMILLFVVTLLVVNARRKAMGDTVRVRNKNATKVARQRLKNAERHLKANNQNEFYAEMSQALWGYIADKFGIDKSNLSVAKVTEEMQQREVPAEVISDFTQTLDMCEFARFAPGDATQKMEQLYQRGIDVITKTEKAL